MKGTDSNCFTKLDEDSIIKRKDKSELKFIRGIDLANTLSQIRKPEGNNHNHLVWPLAFFVMCFSGLILISSSTYLFERHLILILKCITKMAPFENHFLGSRVLYMVNIFTKLNFTHTLKHYLFSQVYSFTQPRIKWSFLAIDSWWVCVFSWLHLIFGLPASFFKVTEEWV